MDRRALRRPTALGARRTSTTPMYVHPVSIQFYLHTHLPKLVLQGHSPVALFMSKPAHPEYLRRPTAKRSQRYQRRKKIRTIRGIELKSLQRCGPYHHSILPVLEESAGITNSPHDRFVRLCRRSIQTPHRHGSRNGTRHQQERSAAPISLYRIIADARFPFGWKSKGLIIVILDLPTKMFHHVQREIDIGPALQITHPDRHTRSTGRRKGEQQPRKELRAQ